MDQRNESGLPASLVNGRLEGLSVPDLLWNLCRRRSTGVLHLSSRGITKKIYIEAGRIVFAFSGDPNDRMGDMLLRDGLITLDQLEAAIVQLSSGKRLGTILVGAGHLSPDNLVRGVLMQVKSIVLGLFPWDEGEYAFFEGPLPTDEVVTLGMRTAEILLQGIRQIRSFSRIRRSVGPPAARYRLDPAWHAVLDGLEIRDGERMLLQRLDEAGAQGASIDALCREVFLSNFEIYQALWAFLVLGVVEEVDRGHDPLRVDSAGGSIERGTLPEILVRLCRQDVTGVLHMSRGTLERTLHIKAGQCIFATSNAVDDGLVAHLLRRGVISLADREETARRLLSNKRVGTILLEMGVIDEGDLTASVRDQLSEIVFDTFRWDHGDFQFLEGKLPTIEEITLDRTIEDLVFAAVRRVTSWPRVKEGCGGLGARLVLLPEYLAVLDRMSVGPEEWELISLLKTPKSVVEICRESVLGDFRSCQILWALRMLGAIGEAAVEDSVDSALGLFDSPAQAHSPVESQPEPQPEVQQVVQEEIAEELPPPPPREPEPEPEPIPVSEMDDSVEVISEPWRLAAEKRPEPPAEMPPVEEPRVDEPVLDEPTVALSSDDEEPVDDEEPDVEDVPIEVSIGEFAEDPPVEAPAPPAPAFQLDSPADATLMVSREEVEAALRPKDDALPHFELGEPGTGLEDMKVDMQPAASRSFELEPMDAPPAAASRASEDFDRTQRVSREELESALQETAEPPVADAAPAPVEEPWDPPRNLEGMIASFNARHVVLFRTLRAEIGAGASNFVRSCRGSLDHDYSEMFASVELRADGSWDPDGLRSSVIERRISTPEKAFARLLEGELQKLRAHLGDARASALAGQLASIF